MNPGGILGDHARIKPVSDAFKVNALPLHYLSGPDHANLKGHHGKLEMIFIAMKPLPSQKISKDTEGKCNGLY